jgi:hypothetical protein
MKIKTILVSVLLIIVFCLTTILLLRNCSDRRHINRCLQSPSFYGEIYINGHHVDEVHGGTILILEKKTGKVLDSTKLYNIKVADSSKNQYVYQVGKKISTNADWKIVLKNNLTNTPKFLIVSDITTGAVKEEGMFSHIYTCQILTWKINGKDYSTQKGNQLLLND